MAGMKPFFLTGANAKVRINGKTLAYVTNLSYSVRVNHASPTILGMYEPTSIEPLAYIVNGSFSVVRYIADVASSVGGSLPNGVKDTGNGIGYWGPDGTLGRFKAGFDVKKGPDGRAYENLDPKKLEKATSFDIEIYQKTCGASQVPVATLRGVRITQADFNIGTNAPATQNFNFTAVYADEDSFLANSSGSGQEFE
jgi:hypothetical protein